MAESEEEVDVLVRRVVKDITNAFKKNPNIDEIGLIPCVEARYNRSPIVLEQNKLGVESWCVKFLLPYVHNKLLQHRQRKHWLDPEALVDITCTLLLLNPDFTTAWNVRKELVQCGTLNPEKDLYLGKLALTKFPKSPETWIHRRWVLQRVMRECCGQGGARKQRSSDEPRCDGDAAAAAAAAAAKRLGRTLRQEMRVCADAADRYPSNYNAWSHRIWVLQHMAKDNVKVLQEELSSMRVWVSMHVSDHSGFHYRQFLLKTLARQAATAAAAATALALPAMGSPPQLRSPPPLQANGEAAVAEEEVEVEEDEGRGAAAALASVQQLFQQELELCTDLIQAYPGHETLWCHRRSVFYLWHHWRTDQQLCSTLNGSHHGPRTTGSTETSPSASSSSPVGACTDQLGKSSSSSSSSCGTATADTTTTTTPNRLPQASEAMDVDDDAAAAVGGGPSLLLPDPRDTKRLKRAPAVAAAAAAVPSPSPLPSLPVLSFEHSFVCAILDGCHSGPDQRRFATTYKKWLDAVIGQ